MSIFRRSRSPPVEDPPLHLLPLDQKTALTNLTKLTAPLFNPETTTLDSKDPWLTLPETVKSYLHLRFLRYHNFHVDKANSHIQRVATWRTADRPWAISESALKGPSVGLAVYDAKTRGCNDEMLVFLPADHYAKAAVDHSVQATGVKAFFEQCAYKARNAQASGVVVLLDLGNLSVKNVDLTTARICIKILYEYYPEAFTSILLVNYPKWFYSTWKCLLPLLDARTVAKHKWISSGELLMEELKKNFDIEKLPSWVGGGTKESEIRLYTGDVMEEEEIYQRLFGHTTIKRNKD